MSPLEPHKKQSIHQSVNQSIVQYNSPRCVSVVVVVTSVSLQLVVGDVGAAVEVTLQRVHLAAQNVPEGLHLRQLLPQAVALLGRTADYAVYYNIPDEGYYYSPIPTRDGSRIGILI